MLSNCLGVQAISGEQIGDAEIAPTAAPTGGRRQSTTGGIVNNDTSLLHLLSTVQRHDLDMLEA